MNYHIIRSDDMLNGDGLRVIIFLSGCQHHCEGCHNPETWDINSGIPFTNESFDQIIKELGKNYISGLTLSGGDPLKSENLNEVYKLVKEVKILYPNKTIWLYTGFTWEQIMNPVIINEFNSERDEFIKRSQIVKLCDILCDGKFVKDLLDVNCPWVGSTNQRVINIKESLNKNCIVLYK